MRDFARKPVPASTNVMHFSKHAPIKPLRSFPADCRIRVSGGMEGFLPAAVSHPLA